MNSQLHFGVYWQGKLEGCLQFGPSLDKRKMLDLVAGTQWHQFIELNRMAFSEALPRNSESRAIAICMKLIKKHAPQIKWVISFADATQCGDGTIYRASGFVLTSIKKNADLLLMPDGAVCHSIVFQDSQKASTDKRKYNKTPGVNSKKWATSIGAKPLEGFQL